MIINTNYSPQYQEKLVSGSNIKTVNGNNLLGSGDLTIEGLPQVTTADNGSYLRVVNGAWSKSDDKPAGWQYIGGQIIVDLGLNQNLYTFYTSGFTEILDHSFESLENAAYVVVTGNDTKPRYIVRCRDGLKGSYMYGKSGTTIGATYTNLGGGKANTDAALQYSDWETNSIFAYIKTCRDNNLYNCNDWYVGNQAEINAIRASDYAPQEWKDQSLWSSAEASATNAYRYVTTYGTGWESCVKTSTKYQLPLYVGAIRSF